MVIHGDTIGPQFGNSRADFFEPGSRIPLPRSPGADFFETGSVQEIPLPRALRALGAPPKAAPGGFLELVSKKTAPGDLGRGIFEPGSKKSALGTGEECFFETGYGHTIFEPDFLKKWCNFLWGDANHQEKSEPTKWSPDVIHN